MCSTPPLNKIPVTHIYGWQEVPGYIKAVCLKPGFELGSTKEPFDVTMYIIMNIMMVVPYNGNNW